MPSQFSLFRYRRFWPLFVVQFLGAFNDNLMKSAVVVLVAYGLWDVAGIDPAVLVSLAAAVFIVPFILFCPLAGDLTDRYDKAMIVRMIKKAEIVLVLFAITALYTKSTAFSFVVLFGLGAQSAFFAPAKYSLLPQHLRANELVAGNGLVSSGTYIAILSGTILGALLAPQVWGVAVISIVLLLCALAGYRASLFVPEARPVAERSEPVSFHPYQSFMQIFNMLKGQSLRVLVAVIGVSWFYFVAGMFHAQFPNYAAQTLGVNNIVLSFFMIVFSIGIVAGALLNDMVLKSKIDMKFVPYALAGIAFFAADLYLASHPYAGHGDGSMVTGFGDFILSADGFRISVDLFFLSAFGGLYVVPLRSFIQYHVQPDQKARIVAGNSVVDAVFILASSLIAAVLLGLGLRVIDLFLLLALACAGAGVYFFKVQPLSGDKSE